MKDTKIVFIIFLIGLFFLGLYLTMRNAYFETMDDYKPVPLPDSNCPNLLLQRGTILLLYNTNQPIVDGKNPITFNNLDAYINYLEDKRKNGTNCPVLFLQQENNAQGQDVFRMRPSPFDLQGGVQASSSIPSDVTTIVDASRENPPYNQGNYPSFDPTSQYVGVFTNVDKVHASTSEGAISDNPMDTNWAGVVYTQQMVDSGKYDENNISKPVLFQPKAAFYPTIKGPTAMPVDVL